MLEHILFRFSLAIGHGLRVLRCCPLLRRVSLEGATAARGACAHGSGVKRSERHLKVSGKAKVCACSQRSADLSTKPLASHVSSSGPFNLTFLEQKTVVMRCIEETLWKFVTFVSCPFHACNHFQNGSFRCQCSDSPTLLEDVKQPDEQQQQHRPYGRRSSDQPCANIHIQSSQTPAGLQDSEFVPAKSWPRALDGVVTDIQGFRIHTRNVWKLQSGPLVLLCFQDTSFPRHVPCLILELGFPEPRAGLTGGGALLCCTVVGLGWNVSV